MGAPGAECIDELVFGGLREWQATPWPTVLVDALHVLTADVMVLESKKGSPI